MFRFVLAILLLLIVLMIALSFPKVQTFVAKKVTNAINERYQTAIHIDKMGLNYKGEVMVKGVYIQDHHKDTLIYAKQLESTLLSFRNLFDSNFNLGNLELQEAFLNVKTYQGESLDNLSIFAKKFTPKIPPDKETPFILESTTLDLLNSRVYVTDENLEQPLVVFFEHLDLEATQFKIHDVAVSASIQKSNFHYNNQLVVKKLQTNFEYAPQKIALHKLDLETHESTLQGAITLLVDEIGFSDFNNNVILDANFIQANLSTNELNQFYNEFGEDQFITLTGLMKGTLNDFELTNLQIKNQGTSLTGNFKFNNVLHQEQPYEIKAVQHNLQSNYFDLRRFMPRLLGNSMPTEMEQLGAFSLTGNTSIKGNSLDTNVKLQSQLGRANAQLNINQFDKVNQATYVGTLDVENFNFGKLFNTTTIGKATASLSFDGKGFTPSALNSTLSGSFASFTFNDYNYQNIQVNGTLANPVFNGNFQVNDPNLQMNFEGLIDVSEAQNKYDFDATIDYADLYATQLFKRDSISIFTGRIGMDMKGTNVDDVVGVIRISESTYQNLIDDYFFDDILVLSRFEEKKRVLQVVSPDVVNGKLSGEFKIKDLPNLIQNSLASIYTNYIPARKTENQYIDFNFEIYNKIVEVFIPQIKLGENTRLKGAAASDESKFKLNFRSPQITAFDNYIKNLNLQVDNNNPLFNTYIEIDSIDAGFYTFSDLNLINVTISDTLFVRSEFKGGPTKSDLFNFSLFHTINQQGKSVVGLKRSDMVFKQHKWFINKNNDTLNKVVFDNNFKDIYLDTLLINHQDEVIYLTGKSTDFLKYKELSMEFQHVDIGKITPQIDSLELYGKANGNLEFIQRDKLFYPKTDVTIDSLVINKNHLGDLLLDIAGNEDLTKYQINASLKNKALTSLDAKGFLNVNKKNSIIDLEVALDNFDIEAVSPFGGEIITNIRGLVSGNAKVEGNYQSPVISGNVDLDNAGMKIPFLNIDFDMQNNTRIQLNKNQLTIPKTTITDTKFNTTASLSGSFNHTNFENWMMDLEIDTDRFLVLDKEVDEEALYYGTAFIDGFGSLKGPVDELTIKVEATTAKGTSFKIPISDAASIGDDSFIYFLSPQEKQARISGKEIIREELKGLTLEFELDINTDAEVEVVVDVKNNSTLKGRGEGILLIQINTLGRFDMWGDFLVYEANYDFRYKGLVQKLFKVERGGNITWDGDPEKAILDIKAFYETQANPSVLLDNPVSNRKIPVIVGIELAGELIESDKEYTIDFPTASTLVKSELDFKLADKQQKELQVLSLISTGAFSGNRFTLDQGTSVLTDRVSSFVNELFANDDGIFNVSLDYSVGTRTRDFETADRVGVTFSSQLSDRILIDGRVGVPVGGIQDDRVAGDFQVQVLLNDQGNFKWNFFNRETKIQFIGENLGFEQGTGLTYSLDFNSFKELWKLIFTRKKKREATKEPVLENQRRALEVLDDNFKAVPDKEMP